MTRPTAALGLGAIASLAGYFAIFSSFFPNSHERLGHDYALHLPKLLAGYYWQSQNGLLAIPWHTPAFCGGVPFVADPQSIYFSLPQLFTAVIDPARSVYATLYVFAAIGFAGSYLLLRAAFRTSRPAAFLGAVLFLFNGFYTYRMVIGHLTFHSYMLLPTIAWLCLRPSPAWKTQGIAAGLALGYVFLSGGVHVLPIVVLGVIAIELVHGIRCGGARVFWPRFAVAGLLGASLSAVKWMPALAYVAHFPRDYYRLPGAATFVGSAWTAFLALFLERQTGAPIPSWMNVQWAIGPIAFEHGITAVPLLVFAAGAITFVRRRGLALPPIRIRRATALRAAALVCLLLVPIALNTYELGWNDLLKRIPFIRNSSLLVQWYSLYIPLVVVWTALVFDRLGIDRGRSLLAAALALAVVASNALWHHSWLHDQQYDPRRIVRAWEDVHAGSAVPAVSRVVVSRVPWSNDALARGQTSMACREAMFGYRLEHFPQGPLHAGGVEEERDGLLNLKKPECYVYADESGCRPGDHFRTSERAEFERFRSYRPYAQRVPLRQRIANLASLFALAGGIGTLATRAALLARRRRGVSEVR